MHISEGTIEPVARFFVGDAGPGAACACGCFFFEGGRARRPPEQSRATGSVVMSGWTVWTLCIGFSSSGATVRVPGPTRHRLPKGGTSKKTLRCTGRPRACTSGAGVLRACSHAHCRGDYRASCTLLCRRRRPGGSLCVRLLFCRRRPRTAAAGTKSCNGLGSPVGMDRVDTVY